MKYLNRYILLLVVLVSCKSKQENSLFTPIESAKTGLNFTNTLIPTTDFNLFSYMYYYNGAGVGAGDFNKDGKVDLFFAANQQSNRLFLNKGEMQFEDITKLSGIPADSAWSTGVSIVDINNDGLLDIYICRVGNYKVLKGKNQLLVCTKIDENGIPHYEDQATQYGLDFSGFSTQAAFLDYDGDGDLDLFLLNHSVNHDGNYAPRKNFENTFDSLAGQKFYRNDTKLSTAGTVTGRFTDITRTVGINGSKIGYGLGVAVADINLDGWPDIYVGNDFHENDYLYINNQKGQFEEKGRTQLMHTSQFTMGVDIADANNDGLPEIVSMDMLPYESYMLRRSLSEDDYNIFQNKLAFGYTYQYARNNLQYNRGNNRFSEVGQYAGIHATDWSWASLWMDFNNDGNKDLFVSNGIPKRMNDIDYINFVSGEALQEKLKNNSLESKDLTLINQFPEIKIPNQFFLNKGAFSFNNISSNIQNNPNSFSNGAVYADLDNDGDLDIVVNNINDPVLVYQNNTNTDSAAKNYASIILEGSPQNRFAVGAKLLVYAKDQVYTQEQFPVHGFLSSMQIPLIVGLDQIKPDSAILIWPDQSFERIQLNAGHTQKIVYQSGLPKYRFEKNTSQQQNLAPTYFEDITLSTQLNYLHKENPFNEFDREPLIPYMVSAEGPALAVADINGDGLEDVFVGASKTFHNAVYVQTKNGIFKPMPQPALLQDSMWENTDAIWVDVNKDGAKDLVIASGGNEYYGEDPHLLPLLYLNDGKGNLARKLDAFTAIYTTQSKIIADDINGDGHIDLFIAGRVEPWKNGIAPRSYLLQNDGKGKFNDVTISFSKELMNPGMVTDAHFVDLNQDGKKDLLLSSAWGTIDAYYKKGQTYSKQTLLNQNGWWQSLTITDVNGDGTQDIIAGNFGLNSRLKASEAEPVTMYLNDFDNNGRTEQVITYYLNGKEIPFASKIQLEKSLPVLKKKFLYAADFANATLDQLFEKEKLNKAIQLKATQFANSVLISKGKGNFEPIAMPANAQLSNYRVAIPFKDPTQSRPMHLLLGNFGYNNIEIGKQDADFGTVLQWPTNGSAKANLLGSLLVEGEVRNATPIRIGNQSCWILAKNNGPLQVLKTK
ncbi:VCBS repeat-containing protein [Sediminibacterium sp.]|uniref:VCBS repeat-containing protein n=1 Tax=Sediminibacterium sp. TaxID=1917865 RepID=UPI003F6FCADA